MSHAGNRKHKHIVQMVLSLLSHAHLPLKFWEKAFTTSVYFSNPLPILEHSKNKVTPLFALFNIHPNSDFLKVFGCSCYPFQQLSTSTSFNLKVMSVFL